MGMYSRDLGLEGWSGENGENGMDGASPLGAGAERTQFRLSGCRAMHTTKLCVSACPQAK